MHREQISCIWLLHTYMAIIPVGGLGLTRRHTWNSTGSSCPRLLSVVVAVLFSFSSNFWCVFISALYFGAQNTIVSVVPAKAYELGINQICGN